MKNPLPLGLLPALALSLALGGPPVDAAPEATAVALRTLQAPRLEGELVGLDGEAVSLRMGDAKPRRVPLDEVIDLTFPVRAQRRAGGARFRITLVGGGEIVGTLTDGASDTLTVTSASLGSVPLLLDVIRALEALPGQFDPCHDLADKHPRAEKGDIIYDNTGDEFRGAVLEVSKKAVLIETQGSREREVAWSALRVLHLENDILETPTGRQIEIEFQDGSRIQTAGSVVLADSTLSFALRCMPKKALKIPVARVRAVRPHGGRFVYASHLPFTSKQRAYHEDPARIREAAFINRFVGLRVDRRNSGCPLRLGGRTFRHGFGVNSHNTITFALDKKYENFRVHFGIDDEAMLNPPEPDRVGNVDARILGDGKVLWESKGVRGGAKPIVVGPLSVKGVSSLVLEVGFGKEMMVRDRADWCDPILVKVK